MPWWLECLTPKGMQGRDSLLCMHEWRLAGIKTLKTSSQKPRTQAAGALPFHRLYVNGIKQKNSKDRASESRFTSIFFLFILTKKTACTVNTGTAKTANNILHVALNQTLVCRSQTIALFESQQTCAKHVQRMCYYSTHRHMCNTANI